MMPFIARYLPVLLFLFAGSLLYGQERPRVILTKADIQLIQSSAGKYPLFEKQMQDAVSKIDAALRNPIDVPQPKDAGGYTHERHKQNYREMQLAGFLYAVTGEDRYARFVRDMLLKYAQMYPSLGRHPMTAGEAYGKLFWQSLNESVWLVHVAQAYDCVYDWIPAKDRAVIEQRLLRPMAHFFTVEHVSQLNRIHNHGTWTVAGVGMLGFALRDRNLVEQALYGSKKDSTGGFLKQLHLLFSPDGYYTEGPYYTRYALMPFFLFAQAIENNLPELKIFEYRNRILHKAFYAGLQQTDRQGRFLPFNDALKEMSFLANEIVIALNISYTMYGGDPSLLSIAEKQQAVMLSSAGLRVARDVAATTSLTPFRRTSVELGDGPDGTRGAIGMLRSGDGNTQCLLLMKYTSHGESHGHYDKLSMMYYDGDSEILQDYGAVRFINVEPKNGGRYLPETASWARQTIAHNTVTVDEKSHYGGKMSVSSKHHADRHFFSTSDSMLQVMSAKAVGVYPGVEMQRTMALVRDAGFAKPIVLDMFRVVSKENHSYDLPFYYLGQFIYTNVKYAAFDTRRTTVGAANGYQHLWKEAEGKASGPVRVTWLSGGQYYSVVSAADTSTLVLFARIGASDPQFNLRHDPVFILRQQGNTHVFASVIEPHGSFNPVTELAPGATGAVESVRVIGTDDTGTVVEISGKNSMRWLFMVAHGPASDSASHTIRLGGTTYSWTGNFSLKKQ